MSKKLFGKTAGSPGGGLDPRKAEMVRLQSFMEMYDLRPTKTYDLIKRGKLPTLKIGRCRYVLLDSARRVFAELEHTSTHREEAA